MSNRTRAVAAKAAPRPEETVASLEHLNYLRGELDGQPMALPTVPTDG